jgi:hypothetical protein
MQEHTPKIVRVSMLLCLLLLSLLSPFLIREYEQRMAYQWEDIVQPHWEPVDEQALTVKVSEDVAEWKTIPAEGLEIPPAQMPEPVKVMPAAKTNHETPEHTKKAASAVKQEGRKKTVSSPKVGALKFKVPDDLYQGKTAEWEEKSPAPLPDFFGPKKESPNRFQVGGRIIVDEEKKKQQPDANYLDTVKGAEINISIKTP